MDIIFLRGLHIETVIGVHDWERKVRQTVIVDLEMARDIRAAAASDDLADTLDYGAVYQRVTQFVEASSFQLVETLAERIAGLILDEFAVPWVRLTLNKKGAVGRDIDVGILIERGDKAAAHA